MSLQSERDSMRSQLESLLREYGITPPSPLATTGLSVQDLRRLRDVAVSIIQGNIDRDEVAKLGKEAAEQLTAMVNHLMSLRASDRLRELQEVNPYYSAFGSKIVRDNVKVGAD